MYLGIAGLALCAVHARANLTINTGDTVLVSENNPFLQPGAYTGYVNHGQGGDPFEDVYAGSFNLVLNDTTTSKSGNLLTFCTDVGINWNGNNNVQYTATAFGSANGVYPAWSAVPQSVQNAAWIYEKYFVSQNPSSINPETAAAVQLAIWKVLYDTSSAVNANGAMDGSGSSFASGNFQANSFAGSTLGDASAMINAMEAARSSDTFTTYTETWLDPNNANSQGLLYNPSLGNSEFSAVPEPATVFAGVLLLLPLGASAYRIVRNRKSLAI